MSEPLEPVEPTVGPIAFILETLWDLFVTLLRF